MAESSLNREKKRPLEKRLGLLETYLALSERDRRDRFVGTASAARITGLSQRTIQSWVETGQVSAVRVGHKYKLDLDSLKAYLKSKTR